MLFERDALRDDTGLQRERWAQEGSVIVNVVEDLFNPSVTKTVYTVTAGKKLYVTDVTVQITACSGGANGAFQLRDGSGGTDVIIINTEHYTGGEILTFNLKTPLLFTTSVYYKFNESGTANSYITISGWEE